MEALQLAHQDVSDIGAIVTVPVGQGRLVFPDLQGGWLPLLQSMSQQKHGLLE